MRKSTHRRPELESLETMLLMSTVSSEVHHAAMAVTPAGPVQLTGTFPLKSITSPARSGYPSETDLVGFGNLGKLGRSLVVINENSIPGALPRFDPSSPQGFELTVAKHGFHDFLAPISLPAKGASISMPYEAGDGEGLYNVEVNPTGTATISDVVSKVGKASYVLKLS